MPGPEWAFSFDVRAFGFLEGLRYTLVDELKYRAILFDLDGTLIDTLGDIAYSTNTSLRCLGFPQHEVDSYKLFVGEGRDILAARALPEAHRDAETVGKLVELIDKQYSEHWGDNTRLYPGISDLLDSLASRGLIMAVLSNKADNFVKLMVGELLKRWNFAYVAGAQPSVPRKPDPTAALNIAAQLDVDPSGFIYLGDSGTDMKTAVGAKMYPVGALWGFRSAEELISNGALSLIQYPAELLDLL